MTGSVRRTSSARRWRQREKSRSPCRPMRRRESTGCGSTIRMAHPRPALSWSASCRTRLKRNPTTRLKTLPSLKSQGSWCTDAWKRKAMSIATRLSSRPMTSWSPTSSPAGSWPLQWTAPCKSHHLRALSWRKTTTTRGWTPGLSFAPRERPATSSGSSPSPRSRIPASSSPEQPPISTAWP